MLTHGSGSAIIAAYFNEKMSEAVQAMKKAEVDINDARQVAAWLKQTEVYAWLPRLRTRLERVVRRVR